MDCRDNLREAIGCLDPFPDTAKFKQINKCYKQIRKDRTSLREVLIVFLTIVKYINRLVVSSSRFSYKLGIERFDVTPAKCEVGSVDVIYQPRPCLTTFLKTEQRVEKNDA